MKPHMLIMRNSPDGMIWQAYEVRTDQEVNLLTRSATNNGFLVEDQDIGYTNETCPGWRDSKEWKDYKEGKLSERAMGQEEVRKILKDIRRDGPYWLSGYHDWLVACFSLRNPGDLHGYTPIACWSECDHECKQWMVCTKDGSFHVDYLAGSMSPHGVGGYGIDPKPAESLKYPSHIFDWIFKDVIPNHKCKTPAPSVANPR